ncbi:MAG: DUF4168 domain-containing protein [Thermodesulfobacteriota bacterium]
MKTKIINTKSALKKILVPAAALCLITAAPLAAQDYEQQGEQGQGYEQEQQEQQGQGYEQQGYQGEQKTADDFEDSDLENFASAQGEVDEIRSEYSDELSGVEDTEKARELQDKYAEQMVDAIEEQGLDVQTYNDISMAMQNDSELREKIEEMTN